MTTTPADARALVLPLEAIGDAELAMVGGKAHSLGVLAEGGFPVPRGVVLTTRALELYLVATPLGEESMALNHTLAAGELPDGEALAGFRQRLVAGALPAEVSTALARAYAALGDDIAVAVRSSGTREDLEGASFAGQYETFLNVRGLAAVEEAVKKCWASLWEPRVLTYALERGGGASELQMAVVVEELVDADVAGVLFTINPLTGLEREVLIEAVFGLGEALVSGKVNADRYIVDIHSGTLLREEINEKQLKIAVADDGTVEIALEPDAAQARTLEAAQLRELADTAGAIQEHYGRPMDVEWTYRGGELAIVQARPVTQFAFSADIGEWTTADFRDGGVSSSVCSPFMFSLYEVAFNNSLPRYLKMLRLIPRDFDSSWCRMFFARPYWSMGYVKRALAKIPGYDEDSFEADLGIDPDPSHTGKKTAVSVSGVIGALPTLFALKYGFRQRLARNREFARTFAEQKEPYDIDNAALQALERNKFVRTFEHVITSFYLHIETSYFTTIYNTTNAKLELKPAFDKAKAACGGNLDELKLVGGLTNLSHIRPLKDMQRTLQRLHRNGKPLDDETVRDFATRWRHNSRKVLDIRVPRWVDDLGFVRSVLERALADFTEESDPTRSELAQLAEYDAERARAECALRWKPIARYSFLNKLKLVRRYAWWREEMRDYSSYAYYVVRNWSLEAGRRLVDEGVFDAPDDVWHLKFQEVIEILNGRVSAAEARKQVSKGRWLMRSFRNFDNPNEIGARYDYDDREDAIPTGKILEGTGCSSGRVTARARVVGNLEEMDCVERGDILVTHFTDPGWTPLFARIAGVVTETGGVLSHAAVISREYGIPAVLAVKGATRAIADGSTITVDGSRGVVELPD